MMEKRAAPEEWNHGVMDVTEYIIGTAELRDPPDQAKAWDCMRQALVHEKVMLYHAALMSAAISSAAYHLASPEES
jgi:hypothetical protein